MDDPTREKNELRKRLEELHSNMQYWLNQKQVYILNFEET